MAQLKSSITGTTIYDKVFPLLDYCGDIGRNERSDRVKSYSPHFSPNNIKRLIISPDVVEVHYHINVPNIGRVKKVMISPYILQQASNLPDYKPIMKILCTERICSSVEEVILLVNSNDGQVTLSGSELSFESLVNNYRSNMGDIKSLITSRYKRLHSFTVAYMNYNTFLNNMKVMIGKKYDFISELPFMSTSQKEVFHNEDNWYEFWGSAGQTYDMDKVGGELHSYFTNIVNVRKAQAKKDAVDAMVKERNKGLEEEVETLFSRYKSASNMQRKLASVDKMCGWSNLMTIQLTFVNPVKLYRCSAIDKDYPYFDTASSETEALKQNKIILEKAFTGIVESLAENLIKSLYGVAKYAPITCKVMLTDCESTVVVPNNVMHYMADIGDISGFMFNGKDIKASLINSCWLLCLLFADRTSEKYDSKLIDREFWKGALK